MSLKCYLFFQHKVMLDNVWDLDGAFVKTEPENTCRTYRKPYEILIEIALSPPNAMSRRHTVDVSWIKNFNVRKHNLQVSGYTD